MLYKVRKDNEDVLYEEYEISYVALRNIIERKCCEYMQHYHVRPQYIKFPMWIYKISKGFSEFYNNKATTETLFGLTPCPTISIESPSDIEVF